MRIEPQSEIVLARGLEDHADSTTYYVQAVIRNAKTDALIATVNLTDQGNRRFTKAWRAPADPTGEGHDILVTYTVYTDSGYTTKSETYGERFEKYRIEHIVRHGSSGGVDIDYKRVEKIVEKAVAEKLAALPKPEKVEMPNLPFHLQPLINAITGLRNDIQAVELPPTDFSGVEYRLDTIEKAVAAVAKTLKATDLPDSITTPVLEAIVSLQEALEPYSEQTKADSEALLNAIRSFFSQDIESIERQLKGLNGRFDKIPFVVLEPKNTNPEPQRDEIDYAALLKR